jgi:hypothetical protein
MVSPGVYQRDSVVNGTPDDANKHLPEAAARSVPDAPKQWREGT